MNNCNIRNYIRSIIVENRMSIPFVDAYPNEQIFYDADEIWESTMDLMESINADVPADQDLHFFTLGEDGKVSGAAFICLSESRFCFTVISNNKNFHDEKDLISECLDEYDARKSINNNIVLEVFDQRIMKTLIENYGFKKLLGNGKLLTD